MSRFKTVPALLLCLLALWLQMIAPALALRMAEAPFDPSAVICHHATGSHSDTDSKNSPHRAACHHCLLCHVAPGGLPIDGRPAFTRFDFPTASPLRWAALLLPAVRHEPERLSRPRGPPFSA